MNEQCPRCQLPLSEVVVKDDLRGPNNEPRVAKARQCTRCDGQLFTRGDFTSVSEVTSEKVFDLRRLPDADTQLVPLSCPVCTDSVMLKAQSRRASEVTMDLCDGCGAIWLDGGELDAIRGRHAVVDAAFDWIKQRVT